MQGVAGQQQPTTGATEVLIGHASHGEQREAGERHDALRPHGGSQAEGGPDGGERRQERPHQRASHAPPAVVQRQPRLAVTWGKPLEGRRRRRRRPVEDRGRPVAGGVGHHGGGLSPPQPVALQRQATDDRRSRGQRIEGAEQVVAKAGGGHLRGANGAARLRVGLQDQHVPAGIGQEVGGDEPVGPCANYDCIAGLHPAAHCHRRWPFRPAARGGPRRGLRRRSSGLGRHAGYRSRHRPASGPGPGPGPGRPTGGASLCCGRG